MGLIFAWMLAIWAVAIASFWIGRYLLHRRKQGERTQTPIAHSKRLQKLPAYQKALKQYKLLIRLTAGAATLALLLGIVLSARPATVTIVTPAEQARDVMLCLDASGSVLRVDTILTNRFINLADSFPGQRIGLTLFNSSAVTIMPLTDDYQLINGELQKVSKAFQVQKGSDFDTLTTGTLADFSKGTSLVSDGLASCINHLVTNNIARSQSVIIATDNEANGTPIVTMTQAAALAKQHNVRIYAIDPGASSSDRAADHAQLKSIADASGGGYYPLSSVSIGSIVSAISKQETSYFSGVPQVATSDNPKPYFYVLLIATLVFFGAQWRLDQ